MNSSWVWFVLRSPDGMKELLFYRDNYFQTDATSSGLYIAYSADSKFSKIHGVNSSPVDPETPPMANDSVWITGYPDIYNNLYSDLMVFPAPPAIARLQDKDLLFAPSITSTTTWYFHCIANSASGYNFYFFNSFYNASTSVISSEGIFAMDTVTQQPGDIDPYVFWCYPAGIDAPYEKLYSHTKNVRAWYGKIILSSRSDYVNTVGTNQMRFLPTTLLMHCSVVNNAYYNTNYQSTTSHGYPVVKDLTNTDQQNCENVPLDIPMTANNILYLLPAYYCRSNVSQPQKISLYSYSDMSPVYKGSSSSIMIPMNSSIPELATFNYATQNQFIAIGKQAKLAFMWDGTVIKVT